MFKFKIVSGSSSCDTWTTQNKMGFIFEWYGSCWNNFKLKQEIKQEICLSLKLFCLSYLKKIKWDFIWWFIWFENNFKLKQEIVNWIFASSLKLFAVQVKILELRKIKWIYFGGIYIGILNLNKKL